MYDFAIVGGGIVGLSTGVELTKAYPGASIIVFEKEKELAFHQTGHNSGVIHSGIYYKPGSFKAKFAREGSQSMVAFCKEHNIEHDICGKLIVATNLEEVPLLENLYSRGLENGLAIEWLTKKQIPEYEPHVNGVAAIRVPQAGIVNYKQVSLKFAELICKSGGEIHLNSKVDGILEEDDHVELKVGTKSFQAKCMINCGGLHSDEIAKKAGYQTDMKIIPFRGEYYKLRPEKRYLVKNLIYPVPNPNFPFLGVHFTRMIGGEVDAGPNAVLSWKKEGYKKTDINIKELASFLTYKGLWKMAGGFMSEGFEEYKRSFSKKIFTKSLQKLIPELQEEDLIPAPAGVRAQAISSDGKMVDDFFIIKGKRVIHVCNAPSPAATASIEIGKEIVRRINTRKDVNQYV
ncbi:L-2-hydroxyglutarate oxidase [Psychrobacillus soli]|uniref:L-2-hydroxyglutarate oxidase n=1 Tax=Psychrobacillus soli TaxID=1543965 RepID=A0A544TLB3_9BACI|nr:L-2-hydroxyglutarate oxidase [Psychrobacillus soli]TQR18229.1 L-2-hydroxyglutarate oxidase [Psychrobacillus soli]